LRPASSSMTATASPQEGEFMRSLWRMMALQWLGGVGSEALEGESTILELLFGEPAGARLHVFDVQREPGVSHRAMMSPSGDHRSDAGVSADIGSAERLGRHNR
jgi:hypothetical protein